jgi:hypothetical protein
MNRRGTALSITADRNPVNESLLSAKDAAKRLGMSENWLRRSDVPQVVFGRRKLYRPSDLARYVEACVSHRIEQEGA